MKDYLYNILLWLDEGINVLVTPLLRGVLQLPPAGGEAHFTVSQTLAELRERGSKVGCIGCWMLTKVWGLWIKTPNYDHCHNALYQEDGTKLPESEDVG